MNQDEQRRKKQPNPLVLAVMLTGVLLLEVHPKVTSSASAVSNPMAIAGQLVRNTRNLLRQTIDPYRLPDAVIQAVEQDLSLKLGIPASELSITEYSLETQPLECQENSDPSLDCTETSLEQWRIVVSDRWVYRSDPQGQTLELETPDVPVSYLPAEVANAVLEASARRSRLDIAELSITQIQVRDWPNLCLEVDASGKNCHTETVTGWQIAIAAGNERLVYHVDHSGEVLLFNSALSSRMEPLDQAPLPLGLAALVKADLIKTVGISPDQVEVAEYSPQTWRDSCLGLLHSQAVCDRNSVNGWRIVLSNGGTRWVYRTDATGKTLGLETSISEHRDPKK
ncbi:hypothetical protein [Oscillatoria acuminata]|uniref:Uncharacterized protein n=1 Tax=Oscillatoria acuminata PCC 6304 TaxID=56110 RepID=K9TPL7_9CYAN|nr:hypothetical protein [Oscillatoria acuminata]AFY84333.1 hypothetical protein Oscil6304_4826 [Oscillatoria acuminata PCC 6304]